MGDSPLLPVSLSKGLSPTRSKKLNVEDEHTVEFVACDIVAGGEANRLDKVRVEFS